MAGYKSGLEHPYYKKLELDLEEINDLIDQGHTSFHLSCHYKSSDKIFVREFRRLFKINPGEYIKKRNNGKT